MASFVPRYCKKHEALKRREEDLLRKMVEGVPEPALIETAAEVRVARVRALKEELAKLPPVEGPNAVQYHQIEEQIRIAQLVTVHDILNEFQLLATKEIRKLAAAQHRNSK